MTHHCAVIGSPISHSMSPVIHRAAYDQLGLDDWDYQAIEVLPENLAEFIASCDQSWAGLSVTSPLKQDILAHGQPDQHSSEIEAANTLVFGQPNRLFNTDVTGMRDALTSHGATTGETGVVIGAGATARSALAALSMVGVKAVRVVARSADRAHASLDRLASTLGIELNVVDWARLGSLGADTADVLLSTVPVDFTGSQASQLATVAPAVFDITYGIAFPTTLIRAARAAGRTTIDGLDLLVHQAVGQVRLMTGAEPAVGPLLAVAREAIVKH